MTVSDALSAADGCTPDVCLLGLPSGRGWSGPDATRAILQRYPGTKVLVLLKVTYQETLAELKRSGVGDVIKTEMLPIGSALYERIEAGRNVLDPGPRQALAPGAKRMCELSPREREIVARIVGGQSTRQMSFAMNITVDTVRTYVKNVLANWHTVGCSAALASREGLLIDHPLGAGILGPADDAVGRSYHRPLLERSSGGRSPEWRPRAHHLVLPAIGVLIVDQHLAFRDALGTRLQAEPDLTVVAKAQSAEFVPRTWSGDRSMSSSSTPSCQMPRPPSSAPR